MLLLSTLLSLSVSSSRVKVRQAGYFLVLYKGDNPHPALTFWADQWIDLTGSSPGQAPIF
jgi:hypothetical protein